MKISESEMKAIETQGVALAKGLGHDLGPFVTPAGDTYRRWRFATCKKCQKTVDYNDFSNPRYVLHGDALRDRCSNKRGWR